MLQILESHTSQWPKSSSSIWQRQRTMPQLRAQTMMQPGCAKTPCIISTRSRAPWDVLLCNYLR
jgi:hypothetical protein